MSRLPINRFAARVLANCSGLDRNDLGNESRACLQELDILVLAETVPKNACAQ
jgi:hypothetical protein